MTIPAWAKAALLLGVTFAAGTVTGVSYERRRTLAYHAQGAEPQHMARRLRATLGLNAAQEKAIAAILARRQGVIDSTWRVMQPHVHATLDSARQEILVVLTRDQAAQYLRMLGDRHRATPE